MIFEVYLKIESKKINLEQVENVEEIAFAELEDRLFREIGKSVARLVLKQAAEIVASNQNENAGFALSALNAFTEKADTRNWQTLPHATYYQRVQLAPGNQ